MLAPMGQCIIKSPEIVEVLLEWRLLYGVCGRPVSRDIHVIEMSVHVYVIQSYAWTILSSLAQDIHTGKVLQ